MSNIFDSFIMMVILANTLILALDRYPRMPAEEQHTLSQINLVFTAIFTIECLVKVTGLGVREFIRDSFNCLDAFTVTMSLVELAFASTEDGGSSFGAMRAIRLFRVFKLFKSGELRILMKSISFTVTSIGNYAVLLMLFIYVYSLIGMNQFAGKFRFGPLGPDPEGEVPRQNFDSLLVSMLTIFQVLIGDNWNYVMYDSIRSEGPIGSLYFISLVMMGNIVMMNLFLAILLGNFERAR